MFGIAETIGSFVNSSMNNWRTELVSSGEYHGTVNVRRSIFQGSILSPLLFVLCMIQLTLILRINYEFKDSKGKINHLLWMI